jgi:hypothetical protein
MPIHRASIHWPISPVKLLACLCLLGICNAPLAAAEPAEQPQLTLEQLENLMLPPPGWKVDEKVLKAHFWRLHTLDDDAPGEPNISVYPFWPAFFEVVTENGRVKEHSMRTYGNLLGGLISDAMFSPNPDLKTRSALWLRQNLILYFAGFRLSKLGGQRPYAPWIKPADARRLDRLADEYVAAQKVIRVAQGHEEITALLMIDWITHPRSTALTDVISYYDLLQASDESIAVDHIYPIRWVWARRRGESKLVSFTSMNNDLGDLYADKLLHGSLADSKDPVCLWLRDVILSYIAGKELLEGKQLLLEDKASEPLLKDALQQWWAGLEKQEQAR